MCTHTHTDAHTPHTGMRVHTGAHTHTRMRWGRCSRASVAQGKPPPLAWSPGLGSRAPGEPPGGPWKHRRWARGGRFRSDQPSPRPPARWCRLGRHSPATWALRPQASSRGVFPSACRWCGGAQGPAMDAPVLGSAHAKGWCAPVSRGDGATRRIWRMPTLAWLGWRGGHVTPTLLNSGARAERLQTPSATVPLGGNPLPGPGPRTLGNPVEPGVGAGQQGWMWLKVSGETCAPSPWGRHPGGLQGHAGPGVHGREAQHRRRAGLTQGQGMQIQEPGVPGLRDAMGRLEDGHGWAPRRQCLSTKTLPGEGGDPLPASRPQRRGQAARPRTPGTVAPVSGPRWLAGSITAHSVLPHTFTAGAQVHRGRVHALGSTQRRQAEAFARAPGAGVGNAQAAGLAQGS